MSGARWAAGVRRPLGSFSPLLAPAEGPALRSHRCPGPRRAVSEVMTAADVRRHRPGFLRRGARMRRRLLILCAPLLALAWMVLAPASHSQAVENGLPAQNDAAQVRLFEHGNFRGGGTL